MNNVALSLRQYTSEIANSIRTNPVLQSRWVIAELSDVSERGGHCYMELVEKDDRGVTIARLRGTIWANNFAYKIKPKFEQITGQKFKSGLKVMLFGSASFHEQYGLSFNITDVDPSFTIGDMERIRREIIETLTREGVVNCNRMLQMPRVPQRIAIISAKGAAGYGDFMNQLQSNPVGFKFYTHLFEATMQGETTSNSVIKALNDIEMTIDLWDCVVIIRGGGATSDLNGFDNLELARRVATFALPVVVGIGHERDRTVLDDIANVRVKTPTAAAEWLIMCAQQTLDQALALANQVARYVKDRTSGASKQLSHIEGTIPIIAKQQIIKSKSNLAAIASALPYMTKNKILSANRTIDALARDVQHSAIGKISAAQTYLKTMSDALANAAPKAIANQDKRLKALENIVEALSPQKTLRRGFSLTKVNGKTVKSIDQLADNDVITTYLADGEITSVVNKK
ncbi:MAG: exodeoxyribonuclease VII large subunit [Muribaculaceae bacterium]|nr:exodeoxyribonuclease VII large subunit [Muribaculaceae bacterium]